MISLFWIACLLIFSHVSAIPLQFEVVSADRTIDISTHLTKITTKIELENIESSAAKEFYLSTEPRFADKLSFLGVTNDGLDGGELEVSEVNGTEKSTPLYHKVMLKKGVSAKGDRVKVVVYEVFRGLLVPFPKEIKQSEPQLITTTQNSRFFSPYKSRVQSTVFKLSSSKIISYTKIEPNHGADKEIEYGPFENVAANSVVDVVVHSENNSPFLTITDLTRWVEVSHWGGNIAIEEAIKLQHSGAKLKGSFSRFDYMYMRSYDGVPSVKSYKTVLPAGAKDVYYRDEIGNISTSHMLELLDSVELEIRPRYPLFGGWETHYLLGYNLPSYQYLFSRGSKYMLKMRFVDHVFDDMSVDHAEIKIVLPEGASDIQVNVPYSHCRKADALHYTFLDISGRPIVTLAKDNLVEDHIQDFELTYSYNSIFLLREPLMIITGLMIIFLSVILFVRMDFSISIDNMAEAKMRVAGAIEQVFALENKREVLCNKLEDAVASFRKTKDQDQLNNVRKNVEAELKEAKNAIDQLGKSVKEDSPDVTERINEIQRHHNVYFGHVSDVMTNAIKVVNQSVTHEAFKRTEESLEQKKAEVRAKINNTLAKL